MCRVQNQYTIDCHLPTVQCAGYRISTPLIVTYQQCSIQGTESVCYCLSPTNSAVCRVQNQYTIDCHLPTVQCTGYTISAPWVITYQQCSVQGTESVHHWLSPTNSTVCRVQNQYIICCQLPTVQHTWPRISTPLIVTYQYSVQCTGYRISAPLVVIYQRCNVQKSYYVRHLWEFLGLEK